MKQAQSQPLVVLIHGLAAHRSLMLPLAWYLRRSGFATRQFGYRSLFGTIESHAERFGKFLDELNNSSEHDEIHIVSHSMGGIVARQTLLKRQPDKVKRLVMLAPPNQGSPVARFLSQRIVPYCQTLAQISDGEGSFVRTLPEPEGFEIGVLAAQHDRVIPKSNSRLNCLTDQVSIFSGHNGLLVRPTGFRHVVCFLRNGKFLQQS